MYLQTAPNGAEGYLPYFIQCWLCNVFFFCASAGYMFHVFHYIANRNIMHSSFVKFYRAQSEWNYLLKGTIIYIKSGSILHLN